MMDVDKLKALVDLMVANDLSELDLRDSDKAVTIKRAGIAAPTHVTHAYAPPPQQHHASGAAPSAAAAAPASDPDAGLIAVESPMVGTYYATPNPDSPAFVTVGASVGPETVVCIIEAMKVFNEVKAECSGRIERILVSSGDAVEFGQKLFLVRPA